MQSYFREACIIRNSKEYMAHSGTDLARTDMARAFFISR